MDEIICTNCAIYKIKKDLYKNAKENCLKKFQLYDFWRDLNEHYIFYDFTKNLEVQILNLP